MKYPKAGLFSRAYPGSVILALALIILSPPDRAQGNLAPGGGPSFHTIKLIEENVEITLFADRAEVEGWFKFVGVVSYQPILPSLVLPTYAPTSLASDSLATAGYAPVFSIDGKEIAAELAPDAPLVYGDIPQVPGQRTVWWQLDPAELDRGVDQLEVQVRYVQPHFEKDGRWGTVYVPLLPGGAENSESLRIKARPAEGLQLMVEDITKDRTDKEPQPLSVYDHPILFQPEHLVPIIVYVAESE